MDIIKISADFLQQLSSKANLSTRGRQHWNLHQSYDEACQKLFNAINVDSYIRPHRHSGHGKDECMIAVRGLLTLVLFDEHGKIRDTVPFGAQGARTATGTEPEAGVQIPPGMWHTVIANHPNSILFEVKAGPFDPSSPKEFASWAPEEASDDAVGYLNKLKERCNAA